MNSKALTTLEFHKIIGLLAQEASSDPGRALCEQLVPMCDLAEIEEAQANTADAFSRIVKKGNFSFSGLSPVEGSLKRLALGGTLNAAELLVIAQVFETAARARQYGMPERDDEPDDSLSGLFRSLIPAASLVSEIRRCILSEEEISDDASPALRQIRRKLATMNVRIHEALSRIINGAGRTFLQDAIITQRDGRYCLPVRAEYKNQMAGMVHDQSASGSTLFIEPMSVVKLNNESRELQIEEKKEIERILATLSVMAHEHSNELRQDFSLLEQLDFIFAKAKLALSQNAARPMFNDRGYIRIRQGRHPLLDRDTVVPIDIELGGDFTLLVVTGPNTGGKTVSLKTVGLFALMGQAGLHIPALDRSELAVFSEVFADIGDEQSIEQSLSTFSSHMTNIVQILRDVTDDSLVLFDELGAGTDPTEGAALAISILSHLHERKIRAMATTHYSELKVYALQTEGVRNASCEFNVETLRPTYRILIGVPGKSNAFAISSKLGLSDEIIEAARTHLASEDEAFEDLLSDLERRRLSMEAQEAAIQKELAEARQLRKQLELEKSRLLDSHDDLLEKARAEADAVLQDAKDYADETMRRFQKFGKQGISAADMERERESLRKKIKKNRENRGEKKEERTHKQHKPEDFRIGDTVIVHSMHVRGIVNSLPDKNGNIMVQMGIIRSRVHYSDLEIVEDTEITGPNDFKRTGSGAIKVSKSLSISPEINLLGMTVDEAVSVLDKYLDDAALAHLNEVRVVHGKGTGKLRSGIHDYLRRAKHAKSFRLGAFGEGDAGVTIVTIR